MTDIAPSSSSQRRLRRWLVLLGALALPLLLITLWTPAYASPGISTPGPGWVGASLNIPKPCRDTGTVGICDTTTQSAEGLYEYKPRRHSVGEFFGASPPEMDPVFNGHTRAAQGRCIVGGVPKQWPAGTWHYGGRWTRTVSFSGGTPGVSWTPGRLAYSFAKDDKCTNPTPTPQGQPTPPPGGAPPPGGTPPPGTSLTVTPTRPEEPPRTPGPTETPEPTPTICYTEMPPPMDVRLYWGVGASFQERRQYTCGYRQNAYFGAGVNYWNCMAPDGLQSVHLEENEDDWRDLDSSAYVPARALWHRVPANTVVGVEFDLLNAKFLSPGVTSGWNITPYDYTNYNSSNRGLLLFVQDLGADRMPGGSGSNEDRLLFLMTFIDGPGMADYGFDSDVAGRGPMTVAPSLEFAWAINTVNQGLVSTYFIPGRPTGLQAYRAPDVSILHRPIFERAGGAGYRRGPAHHFLDPVPPSHEYYDPLLDPVAWPEWTRRVVSGYEMGFWRATLLERDYEYAPDRWPKDNIRMGIRTQPNRAYRIIAIKRGTVCASEGPLSTLSTMYFHTLGDGNVAIAKSAPDQEVRERMITYDIEVRNTSSSVTARNVVVTDELPGGVLIEQVNITPPGATAPTPLPLPISPSPTSINGRTIVWNIGDLAPGETRTFQVSVWIAANAPDRLTNVATVTAENDGDPSDNRAEATTLLINNPTNVAVRVQAPRMVRPGDTFETTITYRNTTNVPAERVRLSFSVPTGVTLVSSSRTPDERTGENDSVLFWNIGTLPANGSGTITLRIRVPRENEAAAIPTMLDQTAEIDARNDSDLYDNSSTALTAVLIVPRPQTADRLWIHSMLDPQQGVYRTSGATFTWPAGEALDFTPDVTIDDRQTGEPYYRLNRRVVAWSFLGTGGLNLSGMGCKAREQPPANETQHADLTRMRGCVYRYLDTVSPTTLRGQGHVYWAQYSPERMRNDVYVITPLPSNGTDLRIQYAVLTEVVETGYFDIDEDGRTDSVLERRTDVFEATYRVELVVPRDAR
jgi:uncharacterized repeat protein (TIGR01451 family)